MENDEGLCPKIYMVSLLEKRYAGFMLKVFSPPPLSGRSVTCMHFDVVKICEAKLRSASSKHVPKNVCVLMWKNVMRKMYGEIISPFRISNEIPGPPPLGGVA